VLQNILVVICLSFIFIFIVNLQPGIRVWRQVEDGSQRNKFVDEEIKINVAACPVEEQNSKKHFVYHARKSKTLKVIVCRVHFIFSRIRRLAFV